MTDDLHRFRSPTPPEEEGVYWLEREKAHIVRVTTINGEICTYLGQSLGQLDGRWTGPLPTPAEIETCISN
jgi:hypothetical protein